MDTFISSNLIYHLLLIIQIKYKKVYKEEDVRQIGLFEFAIEIIFVGGYCYNVYYEDIINYNNIENTKKYLQK